MKENNGSVTDKGGSGMEVKVRNVRVTDKELNGMGGLEENVSLTDKEGSGIEMKEWSLKVTDKDVNGMG